MAVAHNENGAIYKKQYIIILPSPLEIVSPREIFMRRALYKRALGMAFPHTAMIITQLLSPTTTPHR
jgi:hypothetical protein